MNCFKNLPRLPNTPTGKISIKICPDPTDKRAGEFDPASQIWSIKILSIIRFVDTLINRLQPMDNLNP